MGYFYPLNPHTPEAGCDGLMLPRGLNDYISMPGFQHPPVIADLLKGLYEPERVLKRSKKQER